jgi:hypothetical protein
LPASQARRWEQEAFYQEPKVDMRSPPCLQSHMPLRAIQEIAALILAHALLVEYQAEAASSSWPGLCNSTYRTGSPEYSVGEIYA